MANESDLKERLFTVVGAVLRDPEWADSMIRDVDIVDAILEEIEAAGYVLVPTDRMERLRRAARHWFEWHKDFGDSDEKAVASAGLKPGDLDWTEGGG
jgi:hypothetical protein